MNKIEDGVFAKCFGVQPSKTDKAMVFALRIVESFDLPPDLMEEINKVQDIPKERLVAKEGMCIEKTEVELQPFPSCLDTYIFYELEKLFNENAADLGVEIQRNRLSIMKESGLMMEYNRSGRGNILLGWKSDLDSLEEDGLDDFTHLPVDDITKLAEIFPKDTAYMFYKGKSESETGLVITHNEDETLFDLASPFGWH